MNIPETKAYGIFGHLRNFGIGDHANVSGGSNIDKNTTTMQNSTHGRDDQNLDDGSGSTTAKSAGAPGSSYSPPHTSIGMSSVDSAPETQKVSDGDSGISVMNSDLGTRGNPPPATHTPEKNLEGSKRREPTEPPRSRANIANPRPSSGRQLTPEKLRREENSFRQLLGNSEQYDDLLMIDGEDAQEVLNDWQRLSECTNDAELRTQIVRTIIELSDSSGLFPECLWIAEVKNLSKRPVEVGSFGDVWTGSMNSVKVAMKVVRHRIDPQKREQVAFTREAMVWRNLNHPNILPFTGMYWFNARNEGQMSLVTPWMENGNLLQFLRGHPELEPETQLTLAKDVAQGLAYLHNFKITHGDLKSYNVLITPDHVACITDLGLSRVVDAEDATGLPTASSCWRPVRWLAPERLRSAGRFDVSSESDIYAFGYVCYEIFAKHIPFEDIEEYRVYYVAAVQKQHPERPPQVPDTMWRLIKLCWSEEPDFRPKAVDAVDEIGHIQAGRPGLIVPTERPRPGNEQSLFGSIFNWLLGWLTMLG
ncbi:Rho guanine nucleotide exchange factor [Marasmius tenuissimus]|uniref:Rho guanine nucleotide exchange factor n=1 Tax=Marasmius tenuissimus TaxID=585030 RepID=A0ABR2ZBH1_9AGAR